MEIALIGCGASGSAIAIQLVRQGLSKIKLVDIDLNRANKLSYVLRALNHKLSIDTLRIDSTKTDELEEALAGVTVAINAASPVCNIPLMKACLASNVNYIDLASDPFRYSGIIPGTTLDEQLELNSDFVDKNIVAVTNTGFSPGFTDLLCKHVVTDNGLDVLDSIKIFFGEVTEANKLVVSWSPYILLLETIMPPTVYTKGKIIELDSQKSLRYMKFPSPLGEIEIKTFNGHPELRTIPEFINVPVNYVEIAGGGVLNTLQLNDIIVEALSKRVKESVIFNGDILEALSSMFESPDEFAENYRKGVITKEVSCCIIEIVGKKKGKVLKYRAVIQHDIRDTIKEVPTASVSTFFVSFVPAIIAREIIAGRIDNRGVIAPAALNIASEIIKDCKKLGLSIKETSEWQ
jgi:saccharopine dehydrogenase-like NADP-dependent oxidoreductase